MPSDSLIPIKSLIEKILIINNQKVMLDRKVLSILYVLVFGATLSVAFVYIKL